MMQQNHCSLAVALVVAAVCVPGSARGAGGYTVDRAKSYLVAVTGKSGLFSFAAHEHAILATEWSVQESIDLSNLKGSAVTITIPVSSLVIDSMEGRRRAGLSSGPSADDIRKIQQKMLGPEVLDAARYPNLEFVSTFVQENRTGELQLTGQFRMHGQAREVRFPLRYQRNGEGRVDFSGQFTIKQTDFGIQPESIGLGAVKVKDEVQIRFQVSMAPAP